MKRSPIRAKRATPRRVADRDDHGPGIAEARATTMNRANGWCEACGNAPATDWHHRQTKRYGPDCPCNALALCSTCHHVEVHGQPASARDLGWIVSRHASSPGSVPSQVHSLGIVVLTCGGSYRSLDGRPLVRRIARGKA